MNRKQVLTALVVLILAGGIYLWIHHGGPAAASDDDNVPTIVTVEVGNVTHATLHGYVTAFGSVAPAPADDGRPAASARLAPAAPGVVKAVLVSDGAQVKRGQLLVELVDRVEAVAVRSARDTLARQRKLFAEHNTSLKALQQAESDLASAEARLALLQVRAPLSGTVTHLSARAGEAVDLTSVLADVVDLQRLAVSAEIPASEAAALQPGQSVEIAGTHSVSTSLDYVSPTVNPMDGTVTVRAPLPAKAGVPDGATVRLRILTAEHSNVLSVPAASVITHVDGKSVINLVNGSEATQVPVTTGLRDGGLVEVRGAGLKAGDTVVTVGAYGLPAKTQVRIVKP